MRAPLLHPLPGNRSLISSSLSTSVGGEFAPNFSGCLLRLAQSLKSVSSFTIGSFRWCELFVGSTRVQSRAASVDFLDFMSKMGLKIPDMRGLGVYWCSDFQSPKQFYLPGVPV